MTEPFFYVEVPGFEHYPHVTYTWVLMILFAIVTFVVKGALAIVPKTKLHNLFETIVTGLHELMESTIGHGGARFMPLIGTMALFIFFGNMIGLVPGCTSPTANLNTNLAMALTVFVLYHYVGIRKHGISYFKQFLGPVLPLAPLMLVIELLSHIARPITLAVRLFGNVRGEEMVILVLMFLVPLFLPLPMMAFAVFTGTLQTLIFILLSMVYLQGALSEDH